eukprot:TRINITY_DN2220_c0_g1_i2.p1 TRINITY_DN2220_c0_g1~~TRINITY_DN2220_c0_g1_i2.p1  ORF type:complete len:262 (-),score=76.27 TRINITY_DN2220_c0_g1_i2:26-811(-)
MEAFYDKINSQALNTTNKKGKAEQEIAEATEALESVDPLSLDPRARRIHEIKMKAMQARKANLQHVAEEEKKKREPESADKIRDKQEAQEEQERDRAALMQKGLDPAKQRLLSTTVGEAEWKQKRQAKKSDSQGKRFGWELFNVDAQYNAFERRVRDVKFDAEDYNKKKEEMGEDFFKDNNDLTYGIAPKTSADKVDAMADELNKAIERRSQHSRKRKGGGEMASVDYINSRNQTFNQKIARAFDPYTTEIKQNLERGTAL